jgi:alkylation response protein AidB-like acyl-CoA dehydrogenase
MEDIDVFRQRARNFIHENLRPMGSTVLAQHKANTDEEELASVNHDRALQRALFDAGLAGVCVPVEYGGRGLTPQHQRALNEELVGFEYPRRLQAPTFAPCAAVILECGTEAQKLRHLPAILKGEEVWLQMLSEPSGGSDVAGALTSAVRDGDEWVLNGSKVWTTGAWWSDWALCLVRTNWDVPKHRGLTVFMLPIKQAGIEVHRIEMLNGNMEFCQEFLTDVRVPDSDRVGEVDEGWTVGTRWLFHERMLFNSPLVTIPVGAPKGRTGAASIVDIARAAGSLNDPLTRGLIGESRMLDVVGQALQRRISEGIASRVISDQSAAIGRCFSGYASSRKATIGFEVAGTSGGVWSDDDGAVAGCGTEFLVRQAGSIGGGTTEISRNIVSERVLGMPREASGDHGTPFRDVPRGPSGRA